MAGKASRQHISKLVPESELVLTWLLVATAVVNSATLGYDSSMMSGLNILPQYKDYFNLNTATTGLLTAGNWMGGCLSTPFLQWVPDKFGRKMTIVISAFFCIIAAIITATAHTSAQFVVGRIITGFGSQLSSGGAPTLIGETVKARRRGAVLGIFFSCYYVGSLLASAINLGTVNIATTWAWRLPALLQLIPSLLSLAMLPFVPESPRWLIANGKADAAKEVISIIHAGGDVNHEDTTAVYQEIRTAINFERETYPANPWKELVTGKPNLHRLFIVASFGFILETLGNFVISFYLGDMLTLAGITNSTTQLQVNVILNCWCFVVAIAGSFLLDIVGRRPQALWSVAGMIVFLFITAGLTAVYGTSDNNSGIYATIAMIFIFQGLYSVSITPLTTVYPPEIMPYHIRTAGVAVFRFFDCGSGLLYSFIMPYAMKNLGWKFFIVNACYNIVYLVAMYLTWVETARIPLEEIAVKFGEPDPRALMLEGVKGEDDDVNKGDVAVEVSKEL